MLMNLTEQKQAPALFEKTAVHGVPRRALVLTVAGKLIAAFPELTNPL
jgi:amino acid permease